MPDNLRIPPLSGLMAFEAVARHSSFSRAADELSITQSAVSHRIRQLESLLGVSLLLRIGHNVTMTSKGKELLPFVREGISHLKDGIAKLSVSGKPRLKLSLAPAVASNWLIQRLTEFQRIHPAISMDIIVTSKMVNIRSGEADIGIRFGTGEWDGLEAIKLMPVKIIAVCSPAYKRAHPWLKLPSDLANATLLRQTIITWRPWLAAAGVDFPEPDSGSAFSEVSLAIDAAEFSQGVALVPDVLVETQLTNKTLTKLFGIALESERSYYIVTAKSDDQAPELKALIDWLMSTVGHPCCLT